jgi:hypothetical protein
MVNGVELEVVTTTPERLSVTLLRNIAITTICSGGHLCDHCNPIGDSAAD